MQKEGEEDAIAGLKRNRKLTSALTAKSPGERNTRIKSFTNGKISSMINGPIN